MSDKTKNIIETSFMSDLNKSVKMMEVKEEDLGSVIITDDGKIEDTKKNAVKPVTDYNFKSGDLVIPNTGLKDAFIYNPNLKLNSNYNYRLASPEEYVYYMKTYKDGSIEKFDNYQSVIDTANKRFNTKK